MKKITEIANVIRSKNCSPFELTMDIIFKDHSIFSELKRQNAISTGIIAELYHVPIDHILKIIWFEPSNAIKIVMKRPVSSGSFGDTDVYGAQQHAPLLSLEFDL